MLDDRRALLEAFGMSSKVSNVEDAPLRPGFEQSSEAVLKYAGAGNRKVTRAIQALVGDLESIGPKGDPFPALRSHLKKTPELLEAVRVIRGTRAFEDLAGGGSNVRQVYSPHGVSMYANLTDALKMRAAGLKDVAPGAPAAPIQAGVRRTAAAGITEEDLETLMDMVSKALIPDAPPPAFPPPPLATGTTL